MKNSFVMVISGAIPGFYGSYISEPVFTAAGIAIVASSLAVSELESVKESIEDLGETFNES